MLTAVVLNNLFSVNAFVLLGFSLFLFPGMGYMVRTVLNLNSLGETTEEKIVLTSDGFSFVVYPFYGAFCMCFNIASLLFIVQ